MPLRDMNKLTILLSVYNGCKNETLFRNTLDSLFNQTSKEYEVLIINDSSIDATSKILDEYKNRYDFRLINNKKNIGMIESYNKGIDNINTKYITIITDNNELYHTFADDMISFSDSGDFDLVVSFWMKGQNIRNPFIDDGLGISHIIKKKALNDIGKIGLNVGFAIDSDIWYKTKYHSPPYRIGLLHKVLARYYVVSNDQTTIMPIDEKRKELWKWEHVWKIRESRYIEMKDFGHSINSKINLWIEEVMNLYNLTENNEAKIKIIDDHVIPNTLDTYDCIIVKNTFNTLDQSNQTHLLEKCITHLNKNGKLIMILKINKKNRLIDLNDYFKILNIHNMVYYPETNPKYTKKFRSVAYEYNDTKYFRFFAIKK